MRQKGDALFWKNEHRHLPDENTITRFLILGKELVEIWGRAQMHQNL
jgi:hypothetical protein